MPQSGRFVVVLLVVFVVAGLYVWWSPPEPEPKPSQGVAKKLYWFIPDGMRADPEVFNIFRWADEGKLPNLKRMMERGTYGFSKPTFPSHTPTNFATLFTGAYPEVHGVNDGPMHTEGHPLDRVSVGGFNSGAKLVDPIWTTFERQSELRVALLSVPGSTPPELEKGITVRGRWGGWGADFHAVNFQDQEDLSRRREHGRGARLFFLGPPLTQYLERRMPSGWAFEAFPESHSEPQEVELSAWGATVHAVLIDSTDDQAVGYDRMAFSFDKNKPLVTLASGDWSDWLPVTLVWKLPGGERARDVETFFKIKLIRLEESGFFRVRFFFNNVNRFVTQPDYIADELVEKVGPMVDFVDNFPPQLIFYPEDKGTFLEEAAFSLDWHRRAAAFLLDTHAPDVLIHDIYTPNQMLTSRWWMGAIDPSSARYGEVTEKERAKLWEEVHWLYWKLDLILGELLERADEETLIVLSSDHGAVPLDRWVRLNNLLAREGFLKFEIDSNTGEPIIDWAASKAIYLKMDGIYIDPAGLAGEWKRASGAEYEQLRERVRGLLSELRDENGVEPVVRVAGWEDASREFRLLEARCGDLVVANRAGYGWNEEMTADLEIFSTPLKTGYKQAILAENTKGMWTPFVIVGPGVREGQYLGSDPIEMVDQYPTLLRLLGLEPPTFVQGQVVKEALSEP